MDVQESDKMVTIREEKIDARMGSVQTPAIEIEDHCAGSTTGTSNQEMQLPPRYTMDLPFSLILSVNGRTFQLFCIYG